MTVELLIVEDDISLLTELRMELNEIELNIHSESTESGAISYLSENKPDLIIMDLYLNGNNSGHALSSLINDLGIPFIVMTQHSIDFVYREVVKWRPQAFYSKPLDYLSLKYFIVKFAQSNSRKEESSQIRSNGLYVRKRSTIIWLKFTDLLLVEGEGNYISLKSQDHKYIMRSSIVKIIDKLPEAMFIRVHRNFVVNKKAIQKIDFQANIVHVGEMDVPIGRTYKAILKSSIPL